MNFLLDEFRMRLERVRTAMGKQDIDVPVICDPRNLYYLTGYDGWSFYVPQAVIVALEAELPIWIGRTMDANAARISTSLPNDSIVAYADEYVHSQTQHPFDRMGEYVRNRGWGKQRIAPEMNAAYFSAAGYEALRRQLPDAQFFDSNNLVNWARFVKSPQEVGYMRQAARIIERVFEVAADVIVPGVPQGDAVADIYEAQIRGTEDFGGDYTAIAPMLPTGLGTSTPHLTWTDAPFVAGETTILELAAARLRYHCPMARTLHLGIPPTHSRYGQCDHRRNQQCIVRRKAGSKRRTPGAGLAAHG
jgi:ectoine hydrolase